jgi:hypothetical protein
MPERVTYRVCGPALVPCDHESVEQFKRLRQEECVELRLYRKRSRTLGNIAGVLFAKIAAAQGVRVRNIRNYLCIATGRCDMVELYDRMIPVAWGTGPGDMSNEEFAAFLESALRQIDIDVMPMLEDDHQRDEILLLMDKLRGELDAAEAS